MDTLNNDTVITKLHDIRAQLRIIANDYEGNKDGYVTMRLEQIMGELFDITIELYK